MSAKLLQGKVVVFTGKLSMSRAEASAMAQRSGATVTGTVTAATNVIVVGEGAGSKLDKATSKGIDIWTEDEFIRRMTNEEHQERLGENKGRIVQAGKTSFQFSLAWDEFIDLDLHMKTPKGEVSFMNRNVAGVELDVDRRPSDQDNGKVNLWCATEAQKAKLNWKVRPVENIVSDRALPGKYECYVEQFEQACRPHTKSFPFTVSYRVGTQEGVYRGYTTKEGEKIVICAFTVGADGSVTITKAAKSMPSVEEEEENVVSSPVVADAKPRKAAKKAPAASGKKPKALKPKAAKKPAAKPKAKKPAAKKPAAARKAPKKAAATKPKKR